MSNLDNLKEMMKEGEKLLAQLPAEHRAFALSKVNEIKQNIKDGKSSTNVIKEIKKYASSK